MAESGYPELTFDNTKNAFVSQYPKPGVAKTDPAYAFAQSAIGDALRPGPDRRELFKLLGTLSPALLNAQGGASATNPVAGLGAINPLAAQQLMRPGPLNQPRPFLGVP